MKQALAKLLDERDVRDTPSGPLFHYTSFSGLKGILESRAIWLTPHRNLNDPSEIEHGKNIILSCIENSIKKRNCKMHSFLCDFLKDIVEKGYRTFITSFCDKEDYLPAWRYYGDDGAGYSIGFKNSYFKREKSPTDKCHATLFFRVTYGENNFKNRINKILSTAEEIYPDWFEQNPSTIIEYLDHLVGNFLTLLPTVKNIDYQDEREWRNCLIRIYFQEENLWYPYGLPPTPYLIADQVGPEKLRPFLKNFKPTIFRIKSEEFAYTDIDKIYIGPRLDFITAKIAVKSFLKSKGIDEKDINAINIVPSKRPFQ